MSASALRHTDRTQESNVSYAKGVRNLCNRFYDDEFLIVFHSLTNVYQALGDFADEYDDQIVLDFRVLRGLFKCVDRRTWLRNPLIRVHIGLQIGDASQSLS